MGSPYEVVRRVLQAVCCPIIRDQKVTSQRRAVRWPNRLSDIATVVSVWHPHKRGAGLILRGLVAISQWWVVLYPGRTSTPSNRAERETSLPTSPRQYVRAGRPFVNGRTACEVSQTRAVDSALPDLCGRLGAWPSCESSIAPAEWLPPAP